MKYLYIGIYSISNFGLYKLINTLINIIRILLQHLKFLISDFMKLDMFQIFILHTVTVGSSPSLIIFSVREDRTERGKMLCRNENYNVWKW